VERATIVLATDVSGSMEATDVQPNRLIAAKRAAREFVSKVPGRVNVAVIGFNSTPRVLQSPTRDRDAVNAAIDRLGSSGGTAAGEAVHAALSVVGKAGAKRPPGAIVLLSDGATTSGRDPVAASRTAGDAKVPVYTVALGTPDGTITVEQRDGSTRVQPVPPDRRALERMAEVSGGRSFAAATAPGLEEVYERLGSQLGRKDEKRQVTSAFAGGGLLLMLLGAAMSLRWFGRLV
jgi:Ca-activated chloride channel family protein